MMKAGVVGEPTPRGLRTKGDSYWPWGIGVGIASVGSWVAGAYPNAGFLGPPDPVLTTLLALPVMAVYAFWGAMVWSELRDRRRQQRRKP